MASLRSLKAQLRSRTDSVGERQRSGFGFEDLSFSRGAPVFQAIKTSERKMVHAMTAAINVADEWFSG
jgi:hypothetical protein